MLLTLGKFLPRLLGTVSNGLNARQSEFLNKIPQKASPKPHKSVRCWEMLRNVKRFQRSFWFFSWRIVWSRAHHNFAIIPVQTAVHGLKWTKCPAVGNLYQHIHPLESIRCLLRTVMRCYGLVLVETIPTFRSVAWQHNAGMIAKLWRKIF